MSISMVTGAERIPNVKRPNAVKKSVAQKYSEVLADTTEQMETQIKEGPPKYSIGASEYSIKEWDKLIKSVDKNIDLIKEEQRIRKEKMQQPENNLPANATKEG